MSDLTLPEGSVLLHIGPHKTGTTMLQGAFYRARPAMAERGVDYVGKRRQQLAAAQFINKRNDPDASEQAWRQLVQQTAASTAARRVVSSEGFAESDEETARHVVDQLGGERVHILVTLRPLAKILSSAWQQYVRNRHPRPYVEWLDRTLNSPVDQQVTPSFWMRHHHEVVIGRWARVVGPGNVTVIVLDPADPLGVLRRVEEMLALPSGLLEPEDGRANRSLTYGEIEMVRQLNREFAERHWSYDFYREVVRSGVVHQLQHHRVPGEDEEAIRTPKWALDRAAEVGAAAARAIENSGVRVVGDLAILGQPPAQAADAVPADEPQRSGEAAPTLPPTAAADAIVGTVLSRLDARKAQRPGTGEMTPQPTKPATPAGQQPSSIRRGLESYTAAELATDLVHRARKRLRRLLNQPTKT